MSAQPPVSKEGSEDKEEAWFHTEFTQIFGADEPEDEAARLETALATLQTRHDPLDPAQSFLLLHAVRTGRANVVRRFPVRATASPFLPSEGPVYIVSPRLASWSRAQEAQRDEPAAEPNAARNSPSTQQPFVPVLVPVQPPQPQPDQPTSSHTIIRSTQMQPQLAASAPGTSAPTAAKDKTSIPVSFQSILNSELWWSPKRLGEGVASRPMSRVRAHRDTKTARNQDDHGYRGRMCVAFRFVSGVPGTSVQVHSRLPRRRRAGDSAVHEEDQPLQAT